MNIDLQKFFIGLLDFFYILLPGALLTWLLMGEVGPVVLGDRYATLAGAQAWTVFLFASYLFSYFIFLLGPWRDELRDRARHHSLNKQIARLARSKFRKRASAARRRGAKPGFKDRTCMGGIIGM